MTERLKACAAILIFVTFCLSSCQNPIEPNDPKQDLNRLLSDSELITPADPNAPLEDQVWIDWIQENHFPIRSLISNDYSDLQMLKPLLQGKRIVQLGESGHGVSEFSQGKVRLIKFLHSEMAFDIIAFESSIFECFYANRLITPNEAMSHSIFDFWNTSEVLPLFEYIIETKGTNRPLILAGLDLQISSHQGARNRPQFFKEIIEEINTDYARRVFILDSTFVREWQSPATGYDLIYNNTALLVAAYDSLTAFFESNQNFLSEIYVLDPYIPLIALQSARSIQAFIQLNLANTLDKRIRIRDRAMADNLNSLLTKIYPDKKIIIWAHNSHVRHNNAEVTPNPVETMGTWISEQYRSELYTIGLYMYRGQAADLEQQIYNISQAKSGSLESIAYRVRKKYHLIELSRQLRTDGNSWIFEPIIAKAWGVNEKRMVLKDQYDAILFVDTVTPPFYIP